MALSETAKLIVQLQLDDKLSTGLGRTQSSLKRLESAGLQTGRGVRQLGEGLARVGVIAGAAAAGGLVAVAKVAGDFEAQLNTINTVARVSQEELTGIGDSIRTLARDTGTGLNDLTAAYYDLVSAGVSAADAQHVLTDANTLAIGGLATTEEAVDLLTTAMNSYNLTADEVTVATDQFAQAIAAGKVTAADLASTFATVAPIAASSKIEIDELAASYAQLTAAGVPAAEAATDIRSAIVALTRRTGDLEALEKATGKSYLSIAGDKGLVVALQQLREDGRKAGIPLIDLLGRVEGLNFTLATTGPNFASYINNLHEVRTSAGLAAEQMAERQQGLNFQLARLKALATDAGITIGTALLPKLTPLVEKLNVFITENQDQIAAFGDKLAGSFDKFAQAIPGIVGGLEILARVGQKVVDIFLSLPPGVQSALVAGLAINKLSGGLIGAGVGNIAGGLGKIAIELFRGKGQTPLNPLFVQQVGPGIGGPGGPAGGGGGIAGFIKGFLGTAAVAAVIAGGVEAVTSIQKNQAQGKIDLGSAADLAGGPAGLIGRMLGELIGIHHEVTVGNRKQGAATPLGQFNPANQGGTPVRIINKSLFEQIGTAIKLEEKRLAAALKEGDVHQARFASEHIKALNALRGTVDRQTNAIVPKLGETNRALSVANRNLQDGNARQRDMAARIAEARDRIGSGFASSNAQLGVIARKDFSPSFTANITTNVTATLSTYQALQSSTRIYQIHAGTPNSGFQPGLI